MAWSPVFPKGGPVNTSATIAQEAVITRFGEEVGLTQDDLNRLDDPDITTEEILVIQEKISLLDQKIKDSVKTDLNQLSGDDAAFFAKLLSAGNQSFMIRESSISKVVSNSRMAKMLDQSEVRINSFVGSGEALNYESPEQIIAARGLDYEYKEETPYLVDKNGQKAPRGDVSMVKMPLNENGKEEMKLVLDPRLYEKLVELKDSGDARTVTAVNAVLDQGVVLMYKKDANDPNDADRLKTYAAKYKDPKLRASDPPFTGTGFPSHGKLLENGYGDMVPEYNIDIKLTASNVSQYLPPGEKVTFSAHYSKPESAGSTEVPEGSVAVPLASFDGEQITLESDSQKACDANLERVTRNYDKESRDKIMKDRLVVSSGSAGGTGSPAPEGVSKRIARDPWTPLSRFSAFGEKVKSGLRREKKKKKKGTTAA